MGKIVSLEDFRGQIALVTFWSAECPWVERVDQAMAALPNAVARIAIACNSNEPEDLLGSVMESRRLPVVLVDFDQQVADRYGVQITPHCFLIDAGGIVRYQGAFDDINFRQREPTQHYVFDAVNALRAGREVAVAETPPFGCTVVRKEMLL